LPLIASSIMSKKLAAGAHVIVLDVKTGSGAFMQEPNAARELAETMVEIGTLAGRQMAAIVSDMSQPLGRAVGNALEVAEVLDTLEGHGPPELTAFATELASIIVGLASNGSRGEADVQQALGSGSGREALRRMVEAQGGDGRAFDDRAQLPRAGIQRAVVADRDGVVSRLDALTIAHASTVLGAGRERKGDPIDLAVGLVLQAKVGDAVARGQPLAILHANDDSRLVQGERIFADAVEIAKEPVPAPPLILERLAAARSAAAPA
jgi:pyrimidine-nucleoside phosphorylase